MDAVDAARKIAENVHRTAVDQGANRALAGVCLGEAAKRNIVVYALPPDDPQLKGGQAVFDSQAQAILYAEAGTDFDRAFLIAHEPVTSSLRWESECGYAAARALRVSATTVGNAGQDKALRHMVAENDGSAWPYRSLSHLV